MRAARDATSPAQFCHSRNVVWCAFCSQDGDSDDGDDDEEEEDEEEDDLDDLRVADLKLVLKQLGLKVSGRKAALMDCIRSAEKRA